MPTTAADCKACRCQHSQREGKAQVSGSQILLWSVLCWTLQNFLVLGLLDVVEIPLGKESRRISYPQVKLQFQTFFSLPGVASVSSE